MGQIYNPPINGTSGATVVIPIVLINGWTNYDAVYAGASLSKTLGLFSISGLIKGPVGTVVCVLPIEARPTKNVLLLQTAGSAIRTMVIYPNGDVIITGGTTSVECTFTGTYILN